MKYETYTYIEVKELENEWAVEITDCKQEMKPVIPSFIYVSNEIYADSIYVSHILTDTVPEKTINEVSEKISYIYVEVGFWRINNKKQQE
jgi:hypothetical protein